MEQAEYIENKYGPAQADVLDDADPNDFASGGLARLGYQMGGDVAYDATNKDIHGSSAITVTPDTVMDQFGNQVQAEMGNNFNKPLIPQVTEQAADKPSGIIGNPNAVSGDVVDLEKLYPNSPSLKNIEDPFENRGPYARSGGGTDMPVAGGNNNASGILPVMPQDNSPTNMRYRDPGPGIGTGEKIEAVQYNDPLPKDQLLSGFEEYKKTNPPSSGTMALVPVTLPNGEQFTFRNGGEAAAFAQYLQSIGQAPYQRRRNPEMLKKFASGGIARMLGE